MDLLRWLIIVATCTITQASFRQLNESALWRCEHFDVTPCLVLIPSAVRERIDGFESDGWLAIDPGYEQHLSKWCYIRGGHVPFHSGCLPCESPSSPANGCGPLARWLRGKNWRSVCDVYCPLRAEESSTPTPSSAPLEMAPPVRPQIAIPTDIPAIVPEHRDDVADSSLDDRYRPKTDDLSNAAVHSERMREQTGIDTHILLLAVAIIVSVSVIMALPFFVLLYFEDKLPNWRLFSFHRPLSRRQASLLDPDNANNTPLVGNEFGTRRGSTVGDITTNCATIGASRVGEPRAE